MKKQKQFSFLKPQLKFHGGALLYKKRKTLRPLSSKDSIHFVLRSQWAVGKDSFRARRNCKAIEHIIKRFAKKFGIRMYRQSINSNHIHLLLRITNRVLYRAFIKAISGKIASHVMGQQSFKMFSENRIRTEAAFISKKRLPKEVQLQKLLDAGDGSRVLELSQRFWQFRPFSRVVNWGRDFNLCTKYLRQNVLEALGFIPYTPRRNYYSAWLKETVPEVPDANNYIRKVCF